MTRKRPCFQRMSCGVDCAALMEGWQEIWFRLRHSGDGNAKDLNPLTRIGMNILWNEHPVELRAGAACSCIFQECLCRPVEKFIEKPLQSSKLRSFQYRGPVIQALSMLTYSQATLHRARVKSSIFDILQAFHAWRTSAVPEKACQYHPNTH